MMLFVTSFLGTFLLALVLTPLCRHLARKFQILDRPGARKHQAEAMPMLGGVAIAAAHLIVVIAGFFTLLFAQDFLRYWGVLGPEWSIDLKFSEGDYALPAMVVGGVIIVLLGLADDRQGLSIKTRVFVESIVAVLVVACGLRLSIPFLPTPIPEVLTICWIVGLTNSINLIDGLDGLCAGVCTIAALSLGAVLIWGMQPLVASLLLALAGATAGVLVFNFPTASLYMGSAGSIFLGYSLACATALATFTMNQETIASLALPVIVFAVPLYDTFSVIVIRLREGVSIGRADQNHLHHRLLRLGFSRKQATLFIWLLTFATALPAMTLVNSGVLDTVIVLFVTLAVVGLIVLLERVQGHFDTQKPSAGD